MRLRHFIFDLDGTVIDTEEGILKTWQKTLCDYGYKDFTLEQLTCVLGVITETSIQRLGVNVDDLFEKKWQNNYQKYKDTTSFFSGVREALQIIKGYGCYVGTVSSRSRQEYKDYFSGEEYKELFDTVVLAEDSKKHKPNPDPILRYLEITGAKKQECIYIGDMSGDIWCAKAAGICAGLVKWNDSAVKWECKEADYIFYRPEEILKLLQ